jgi:hypothetical protein
MIGEFIGKPEWLFTILPAAAGGMSILGVGMLFVLIASNRKLRNSSVLPASLQEEQAGGVQ